ncbi:MAG: aromatic-ring-hydroxylating dioxygenase subunit beta [Actinomycetota bacterium]
MKTENITGDITEFLSLEAELLDSGRLREWLGLLTDDVRYRVPIRIVKERSGEGSVSGVVENMYHLDEDHTSLEMRVERLETGFAWAEDPPSRIRHFVSNVRVDEVPERQGEVAVRSNVLVYRSRWDKPTYDLLSAERLDVLRQVDGAWKLAKRDVILDNTTLPTLNLSFFF